MRFQILLTGLFLLCLADNSNAFSQIDKGCQRVCDCPIAQVAICSIPRACNGPSVPSNPYCVEWPEYLVDFVVWEFPQCAITPGGESCGNGVYPCTCEKCFQSVKNADQALFNKVLSRGKSRLANNTEIEQFKRQYPNEYKGLYDVATRKPTKDVRSKRQPEPCYEANDIREGNCFVNWYRNVGNCCGEEVCGDNVEPHCQHIVHWTGYATLGNPTFVDPDVTAVPC